MLFGTDIIRVCDKYTVQLLKCKKSFYINKTAKKSNSQHGLKYVFSSNIAYSTFHGKIRFLRLQISKIWWQKLGNEKMGFGKKKWIKIW